MKKLFFNTLFFAALISAQTSFAQERKVVEEKPTPTGGRTPAAIQAAPASNSKGQENRATPATPASRSAETKSATPAQPANRATESKSAEPAQPAKKELQPAKNVKKTEAQPAPGQSRISVNEGGLPATKTESKKVD